MFISEVLVVGDFDNVGMLQKFQILERTFELIDISARLWIELLLH
jgi:hypothetical protein